MIFLKSAFLSAAALIVVTQVASAQQRCPPNSRAEAVPIPGNLATAQCFCNPGFTPVNGRCVRVRSQVDTPAPNDPARSFVAPMPLR
jgi:hypothetical protein